MGRVCGIDYSDVMVRQAAKRNAKAIAQNRVELKQGDMKSLPYADNTFDKVFAIQVLYFLTEPMPALKEIYRSLSRADR